MKALTLKQPKVGHFIRDLRSLTGLTQEQLAAELGVTYNTVNRWERGRMQPSPLALKQVTQFLDEQGDRAKSLIEQYFSDQRNEG